MKDRFGYGTIPNNKELERIEREHGMEAVNQLLKQKVYEQQNRESIDYIVKDAIDVNSHSDLESLIQSNISEEDYVNAAIKFERKLIKNAMNEPSHRPGRKFGMKRRSNMSYEDLYQIYSKAYKEYRR